jgi:hypothetical protein
MHEYIYNKSIKDLEKAYDKYTEELGTAQGLVNDKKKACIKL